ncbi:MAG: hypothetical protein ACE5GY_10725, partial [Thermodesulfobacteriota bacterium]
HIKQRGPAMEKLSEQDKKRCLAFLQSFIDEGKTVDELLRIVGFLSTASVGRIEFLKARYRMRLRKLPACEAFAQIPDDVSLDDLERLTPLLAARLQEDKDADEGCGKERSGPR